MELRFVYVEITPPAKLRRTERRARLSAQKTKKENTASEAKAVPKKVTTAEKNLTTTGLTSSCQEAPRHAGGITQTNPHFGPYLPPLSIFL